MPGVRAGSGWGRVGDQVDDAAPHAKLAEEVFQAGAGLPECEDVAGGVLSFKVKR